jgi:hypothetical protein
MPPESASVAKTTISRVSHCLANEHIVGFSPFYNYNFDSGNFFLIILSVVLYLVPYSKPLSVKFFSGL